MIICLTCNHEWHRVADRANEFADNFYPSRRTQCFWRGDDAAGEIPQSPEA